MTNTAGEFSSCFLMKIIFFYFTLQAAGAYVTRKQLHFTIIRQNVFGNLLYRSQAFILWQSLSFHARHASVANTFTEATRSTSLHTSFQRWHIKKEPLCTRDFRFVRTKYNYFRPNSSQLPAKAERVKTIASLLPPFWVGDGGELVLFVTRYSATRRLERGAPRITANRALANHRKREKHSVKIIITIIIFIIILDVTKIVMLLITQRLYLLSCHSETQRRRICVNTGVVIEQGERAASWVHFRGLPFHQNNVL